ncbi:MAG: hypothetical protein EZS28_052471 [Streblomastix strix]|uniref:SH3 domain-containing protein n=1 Tax=Streblomastix strix TaxID=222440 RepID=A0A5J4S623_9EUKA|nr:MAG: hypothetical protein EZS28_052471 [Streblomastix strix]
MSNEFELYEVIADYGGDLADTSLIPVIKGEIVKVVKKDIVWYQVSKYGQVGKVPRGKLRACPSSATPSSTESKIPATITKNKTTASYSGIQTLPTQLEIKITATSTESKKNTSPSELNVININ